MGVSFLGGPENSVVSLWFLFKPTTTGDPPKKNDKPLWPSTEVRPWPCSGGEARGAGVLLHDGGANAAPTDRSPGGSEVAGVLAGTVGPPGTIRHLKF